MRNVFRLLLMASVLVIVALVSALTAMRLAVHGSEVRVPDLKGKTPAEARAAAENLGLEVQVEREYYSASVPNGRVVSQMPEAGTTVRRGWELQLAVSLGPQRVAIPQVVGESERAAEINIAQRGLQLGSIAEVALPGSSAGEVLAQNPAANATGVSEPKMNLLVGEGPGLQSFLMPSFVGQPLGSVTNILKDAGFAVGKIAVAAPASPAGSLLLPQSGNTAAAAPQAPFASQAANVSVLSPLPASLVVSQDPAAGSKVTAGAAINFVVSGP